MALASTFLSIFPPTPSLNDFFKDFDLDYFLRNREQFVKIGLGIGAQETGRI